MLRGQAHLVVAVAGTSCPLGYKGAKYPSYSECVDSLRRYEPLSFMALTCMPCFWGGDGERFIAEKVVTEFPHQPVTAEGTILEFTIDDKGASGKDLYYARGSSSCWGIPGLAPQMDGSVNVVPDEGNLACTASGSDYQYYQHLIVPLTYDGKWDIFHRNEVHIAEVEFYGHGYDRDGTVEWEYGCKVFGADRDPSLSPDYTVSCTERPPMHDYSLKGYTVSIQPATAVSSDVAV